MTKGNLDADISVRSLLGSVVPFPDNTEIYTMEDHGAKVNQLYYGPTLKIPPKYKDCRVQFCAFTGAENLQIRIAQP